MCATEGDLASPPPPSADPPLAPVHLCILKMSILMGGFPPGSLLHPPVLSRTGAGCWAGAGEFQPGRWFGIINHQGAPGKKQELFGKIC